MSTSTGGDASFGKYQLIAELGHGGMAEVFLAVVRGPVGFSKLQVIKQLRRHLADSPEFLAMFLDEARLAARLNHPNVVQTNEVGSEGGRYYIAMEFLEGQSLDRVIRRAGKEGGFPLPMLVRVVEDALSGLHHAHELTDFDGAPLGVVHRDVTPHNVFVTYDGVVKMVDFGIAKAANSSSETRTETGVLKGKISYMSPEQARGDALDRRADLFSLGILLWEGLAGARPWQGLNDMQILNRLANEGVPPLPPEAVAREPELARITTKVLSKLPEDRHATAAELHADIEKYLATLPDAPTTRDVGRRVNELFADKRAELKTLIEAQLRELKTLGMAEPVRVPGIDTTSSGSSPVMRDDGGRSSSARKISPGSSSDRPSPVPASSTLGSTLVPISAHRRAPRWPLALAGAAALALGLWLGLRSPPRRTEPKTADSGPSTAQPPAPVSAQALPTLDVHVSCTPPEARLFFDGALLPSNPYAGRMPRDGATHRVRAEAAGYVTRSELVTLSDAVMLDLTLDRDDTPVAKPAAVPTPTTIPRGQPTTPGTAPKKGRVTLDKDDPWAK